MTSALRAALAGGTPRPWAVVESPWGDGSWITNGRGGDPHAGEFVADCDWPEDGDEDPGCTLANATLICEAVNAAEGLLVSIEQLTADRDKLRALLREVRNIAEHHIGYGGSANCSRDTLRLTEIAKEAGL